MAKPYQQYHTAVKLAVALRLEKQLLPKELLEEIPTSTANYWQKNFDIHKLIGHQHADAIQLNIEDAQKIIDLSTQTDRKVFLTVVMIKNFLVALFTPKGFRKMLREHKVKTIKFVDWISENTSFSLKKISNALDIETKTISNWKNQINYPCKKSVAKLCKKRHPSQATPDEIQIIKSLLTDPKMLHWGIACIQGYAFKNGLCYLSPPTWYRYNKMLGIRKSILKWKKPAYTPLRANCVNQIWHADITVFKTLDGIRHFIYTIKDNFSRKTLVWEVADRVCANIRMKTIQKAIDFAFSHQKASVRLITDGGPENDNLTMKDFIINAQVDINHQIALKDIVQSNSMAESSYLSLKQYYLYGKLIHNRDQLIKELEFYFNDHDFKKPHSAHKIYTPDEVYNGADPSVLLTPQYKEAARKRRDFNRNNGCGMCPE